MGADEIPAKNVWLCEHLDFELLRRLQRPGVADVLAHGTALAKYRPARGGLPAGPLGGLSVAELEAYRDRKAALARAARTQLAADFAAEGARAGVLDPVFGPTLERLFHHAFHGSLDAWTFAEAIVRAGPPREVRVVAGGRYRLTELSALFWWLAISERLRKGGSRLEYFWTRRDGRFQRAADVHGLVSLLVEESAPEPALGGRAPDVVRAGGDPVCVAWVGALRYPRGWEPEMQARSSDAAQVLRIAEPGRRAEYPQPCLELSAGSGVSRDEGERMLAAACSAAGGDAHAEAAIRRYFADAVAPVVIDRLGRTISAVEAELAGADVRACFSVTAPFLESIALHEWVRRRGVLPVLLPHSFTSSHEFPSRSYETALSFFRSDEVMASAREDPGALDRERIVSLAEVRARQAVAGSPVRSARRQLAAILRQLVSLPLRQTLPLVAAKVRDRGFERELARRYAKGIARPGRKVGLLLNYEQWEFFAGLDFNHLYRYIAGLGAQLGASAAAPATLVVRRKPGWTNLRLLEDELTRRGVSSSVLLSPDSVPLQEFGQVCDIVAYAQGTSAIPELTSLGVPVVELAEPDAPVMLDEPCIVLPGEVVPRMRIREIAARIQSDPGWTQELSRAQRAWARAQTA